MLRELSALLLEIHDGLSDFEARSAARGVPLDLTGLELRLPLDVQLRLRDGGLRFLADVPRSRWGDPLGGGRSRLHLTWERRPRT